MSLAPLLHASGCLFAPGSLVETVYRWDQRLPDPANARAAHTAAAAALTRPLDGAVVWLPAEAGRSVATLAAAVRPLLVGMAVAESGRDERWVRARIPRSSWRLRIAGQVVYPLAFGPCYGPDSSRYTFGLDASFVLLQPAAAFTRRHDPATGRISGRARELIRAEHRRAGRGYDLALTLSPFECHRVVKPARRGAHPVVWW